MNRGHTGNVFLRMAGVLLALCVAFPVSADEPGVSRSEFQKLHTQLAPKRGNRWRMLPWKTSLVTAVKQASRMERPVYMLVRSGHPLGCV